MTTKRRIKALECAYTQKRNPPKLEIIRTGDGWVYLKWGNRRAGHPIKESLYDAI